MQNHRINSSRKRIPRVFYRTSPCNELLLCVRAGSSPGSIFFAHQNWVLTGGSRLSGASGGARPRAERGDREAAGPGGAAGWGGQRGRGPAGPGEGGEDPRPEERG